MIELLNFLSDSGTPHEALILSVLLPLLRRGGTIRGVNLVVCILTFENSLTGDTVEVI